MRSFQRDADEARRERRRRIALKVLVPNHGTKKPMRKRTPNSSSLKPYVHGAPLLPLSEQRSRYRIRENTHQTVLREVTPLPSGSTTTSHKGFVAYRERKRGAGRHEVFETSMQSRLFSPQLTNGLTVNNESERSRVPERVVPNDANHNKTQNNFNRDKNK